ncbi:hypothetical protein RHS01_00058 [Rhizoctonia solani]|uniref:Uncharacterized protein n=1 Tax=Rhizoctonia solani TaxID=456999 RepID=A0A8H7ILZ0_9AGAM|nr:hypothetical protein RHS01_00058 [Rhizoctonia solani]
MHMNGGGYGSKIFAQRLCMREWVNLSPTIPQTSPGVQQSWPPLLGIPRLVHIMAGHVWFGGYNTKFIFINGIPKLPGVEPAQTLPHLLSHYLLAEDSRTTLIETSPDLNSSTHLISPTV